MNPDKKLRIEMYAATIAAQLFKDINTLDFQCDLPERQEAIMNRIIVASISLAKRLVEKIEEEELQQAIDKDQRKA